jgi:hypothetical protein
MESVLNSSVSFLHEVVEKRKPIAAMSGIRFFDLIRFNNQKGISDLYKKTNGVSKLKTKTGKHNSRLFKRHFLWIIA